MAESLTLILLIVFIGVAIIPIISKRLMVPVIVTEIIFGIIVGESWLKLIPANSIVEFFSSFGLVYLFFDHF